MSTTTGAGRFPDRTNNFDLIRIVAALQVAMVHGHEHLHLAGRSKLLDFFIRLIEQIPGVPIFFTVSGFLIVWAFDRTPDLRTYARNRFLRIYPALWETLLFTVVLLAAQGFIARDNITSKPILAWFLGQLTVVQVYTPHAFRAYGLGNPNGALWTIFVELQFYCIAPIVVWSVRRGHRTANVWIAVAAVLSLTANVGVGRIDESLLVGKLWRMTLAPWFFYFLTGTAVYVNWHRVGRLFQDRLWYWLAAFFLYSLIFSGILRTYVPNYWPNVPAFGGTLLLAALTISVAFSARHVSHRILRGNDLSYGLYLFHCIVLNVLVHHHFETHWFALPLFLAASGLLALFSWRLVERPALRLKGRLSTRSSVVLADTGRQSTN